MANNLRIAIRGFVRTPGFTTTALVTLALCLGANLTIFSVVDAILLRPLPFPHSEQLVTIYNTYPRAGVPRDGSSLPNYYERRGQIPALSHLSLIRYGTAIVGDAGATERTEILRVTSEFFATMGIGPVMGRSFDDGEMTYQTNAVAILTDGYWRQHFGGDPEVLGRTVRVDGAQKTIVGVLPPTFRFLSSDARLLLPLASAPEQRGPNDRHSGIGVESIARLKPGATISQAQAQIDAQNAALERTNPQAQMMADAGFRSLVVPLHEDHVASVRPVLLLLQAGVAFLVLIGAVNLVNLLLIRASARTRELAIRQSMGAQRRDVVRQVVLETTLLTMSGGVLALFVGMFGIQLLSIFGVRQLPLAAHVALDGRLAAITLAGAALLGIAIALPVAWFNLRGQLANALKSESRGGTSNRSAQRLRHGFIVAQVSLAFVLLAGSGLLWLSLQRAMAVSPGFRPDHLVTASLTVSRQKYGTLPGLLAFTDRLMSAVREQPGVVAVGLVTNIPLSGRSNKSAVTVNGYRPPPGESVRGHYVYGVTGDYFAALGVPLRDGRFLNADDATNGGRVCVIDEDFARRYWPNGGAIGQQLFQGSDASDASRAFTIVGVVGAVKQAEVTENQAQGAAYFPFSQRPDADMFLVTRTVQAPDAFSPTLARVVREIDADIPVDGVRSMEVRIADSLMARRSPALLAAIFAAVALLLAAVGTYGVLSYAVSQRRREIGVRIALGAQPRQIGSQFLAIGLRLVAGGAVIGAAGAWMAGRLMQGILYNVPGFSAVMLLVSVGVLAMVSFAASVIPARRASRVDPMVALSAE
ncbi:MAG: ABC transporter permease [Gemmatimonadaceae bacterium]